MLDADIEKKYEESLETIKMIEQVLMAQKETYPVHAKRLESLRDLHNEILSLKEVRHQFLSDERKSDKPT